RRILAAGPPPGVDGFVERAARKIAEVTQVTGDEQVEAIDILHGLPRGAALLHGDLHPGNVLMAADGPIAIDWFDASIGHPIADVVRSSLLMRPFGDRGDPPHLPDADVDLLRRVHDGYVGAMADIVGAPADDLRRWEAVVAISRLAEGAQPDGPALVDLWRRRAEVGGPLFDALSAS
ncbi:MAG: phosphotransferase, partial [Ilumatobacter sp.]|nr:phosphotransferase [Ilumatobacter sp.]